MNLSTIILAAGQGTRMRSALPKVLHRLGGISLLEHVVNLAQRIGCQETTVVYGHGGDQVREQLSHLKADWVEQREQLGTGHAVMQAADRIRDDQVVLILYGDVPCLRQETIRALLACMDETSLAMLTADLQNPTGYGRIMRDPKTQSVQRIVEEKDATSEEKQVTEVNSGIMAVAGSCLKKWLSELSNNNAQGEYYLTDIVAKAVEQGFAIKTIGAASDDEIQGVNNRQQLAQMERVFQRGQAAQLMLDGITLMDPDRFDLRGTILEHGRDVTIDVNVVMEGEIMLGNNVRIHPNCIINNCKIGDNVEVFANSVIEGAVIGDSSRVGPFARIRPQTELGSEVRVGNFVEIKKSRVDRESKINHLSYIGDTSVGCRVNVGAGTITCNYDGAHKHQTVIEDDVFIGSDSQLVAPVKVAKNSTIGAGSTITRDTPDGQLSLSRSKQFSVKGWARPKKGDR